MQNNTICTLHVMRYGTKLNDRVDIERNCRQLRKNERIILLQAMDVTRVDYN